MKRSILALFVLAALVAGCGLGEKQRQAQEYEQFLKNSLGSVAVDQPAHSSAY